MNYNVEFLLNDNKITKVVTADNKSEVIEKLWKDFGNTINIREIKEVQDGN